MTGRTMLARMLASQVRDPNAANLNAINAIGELESGVIYFGNSYRSNARTIGINNISNQVVERE
jgi:hypothetical protein